MKVRESGMPEEMVWESLFDVALILRRMGIDHQVRDLEEFGCGYGTFTIPAAKAVRGQVFALDIEPSMVDLVIDRAREAGLTNVAGEVRDFVRDGSGLPDSIVDYVMLFNILHAENPVQILSEAYRILRPGGRLGIIHWRHDPTTPRGPPMTIRPRPEQCREWAEEAGFYLLEQSDLKPYHYGLLFEKAE